MITSSPKGGSAAGYPGMIGGSLTSSPTQASAGNVRDRLWRPELAGNLTQAKPGGTLTGQSTQTAPKYISADSTQSAINNRMGQAHMMGDQRLFQKQFQRNGLSASKGTKYFSQIGEQQALAQGRADSAGISAQDQMNNAKARLDFQNAQEREAQALAMVQHALSQSSWGQQFARQQAAAGIQQAQQQAQLDWYSSLFQ